MFYDFRMEKRTRKVIEFVKAEASRLWHEMFRLKSYGGKRRADREGAAAGDSGICLFLTQLRERECAVTCPLVPRGAPLSTTDYCGG